MEEAHQLDGTGAELRDLLALRRVSDVEQPTKGHQGPLTPPEANFQCTRAVAAVAQSRYQVHGPGPGNLPYLTDGNECLFKVLLYCRDGEKGCVIVPEQDCSSDNSSNRFQAYTRITHDVIPCMHFSWRLSICG